MSSPRVARTVYRELLRHAKLMDKHAAVKALISPTEVSSNARCQDAVSALLRQKMYYLPYASAADVVRNAFRSPSSAGDLGAAFMAMRFTSEKLHVSRQYGLLNEPPFPPTRTYDLLSTSPRATSPSSSSVAITTQIRSGVFLIAHPMLFRPFEQSVVLITSHGETGTTGFVFLHSQPNIGGIAVDAACPDDSSPLFVGGNLLDFAKLPHSKEVVFFNGYAGWTPHMLEKELDMGSWIMVTAPLSFAIHPPTPNLWRHLLKQLGHEYDQFARIPPNVDFTVHVS
ncbi:hypothetical protein AaE_000993 [Aphanomyces astaci]|uniref:YqgE/AlgH family protein n=1 Tax=Aphanomyces astaci TaxID=112090 RepID=A0A6A5AU97_APHAT|nr:hypothetical protein AaE_000993 [Aphanomyces astaci]